MTTSATDLILPVGLLIYTLFNPLTLFFVFLWKGGNAYRGISFSSILGLVFAVLTFGIGITPQPVQWYYDNQTISYTYVYLVQQAQAVDLYLILVVYHSFLIIVSVLKMMLETDFLGGDSGE